MPAGRPVQYSEHTLTKAREYIDSCQDSIEEYHKTRGEKSDSYERIVHVKIPTIEGLSAFLGISRETVYDWEKKYEEFSDILTLLRSLQADRLINAGLSGTYNPTIAKVLLTKHGYREGVDTTTDGQKLPAPITTFNGIPRNNSNEEDRSTHEED